MAHLARVPREPVMNLDDYRNNTQNTIVAHNTEARTWQQEAAFGTPKKPRRKGKGKMTELPASAYVPPHKRKKSATPAAGNPSNKADCATNLPPSPPTTSTPPQKAIEDEFKAGSADSQPAPPVQSLSKTPPTPIPIQKSIADAFNAGWVDAQRIIDDTWNDGAEPQPAPPVKPVKKSHNPRWPSRGQAPRGQAPQKMSWPKIRAARTPPSDDESDGGVSFKSDSNGDPDYDVAKLVAWHGGWLEPPVDWSARHRYTNRRLGDSVEAWINGQDESCTVNPFENKEGLGKDGISRCPEFRGAVFDPNDEEEVVLEEIPTKEIVPRTWVPTRIEGEAPHHFWRALPSRAPPAFSDVDLTERSPFWAAYSTDPTDCFLAASEQPVAIMDLDDRENNHPKSGLSCTEFLALRKERLAMQARKVKKPRKVEERPSRLNSTRASLVKPPVPRLNPTANIYLRPVVAADAEGIREIYNYYVDRSISVPEFELRNLTHILNRMNEVTNQKLPYIVAIAKGNPARNQQHYIRENVVGFASMTDFCDRGSMYRFTMEMELFVHPGYTRKGIARCLLDRLLSTVSTGYKLREGYQYEQRGDYLKNGAGRVVKTVNIAWPHGAQDNTDWVTKFLNEFDFKKAGHLRHMGAKLGKEIDVTTYQHVTAENINFSAPPQNPW